MHNTYHRVGHGPHSVIVLHGWFGDAHAFAPMEAGLDGQAFSYIFMDSRGYGGMRGAAGAYTLDEVAGDALALADALDCASFSVVGHSMGGMALGWLSAPVVATITDIDTALLAMAMAALGLTTHMSAIRRAGIKPLLLAGLLFCWLIAGGAAINHVVASLFA